MAKQTFTVGQVLTAAQMTSLQQTAMGGGSATAKTASYTLVAADAGTTIIMNSASSTTITVNTALFAAGDTVLIVNQGAGVCTITAGTATVSAAGSLAMSQYETGQLYFLSASAAIFTEYVQTAGASGLTLIARTSFSGVASQAFDSVFTSTYSTYFVAIEQIYAATGDDDLHLQLRYAGPTTQILTYYGSTFEVPWTGSNVTTASNNTTQLTIARQTGSSGTVGSGYIYFNQVGDASVIPNFRGQYTDKDANQYSFGGNINTARIYTGFLLKSSSTNITGTVAIYGMAKS